MGIETGAIIALALIITSSLSNFLNIPKKLRAWTALFFIVLLNIANEWLFVSTYQWRDALLHGINTGLATIGIHSVYKNTIQHYSLLNGNKKKQEDCTQALADQSCYEENVLLSELLSESKNSKDEKKRE